jgi:predicted AAA+ superfamily ATPase
MQRRYKREVDRDPLTTRAISTPKLIVTDSGLGGRLIGMSEERAKDPTAPVGPLLENFVIGEVARQLTWAEEPVQLFHYRDRDQVEVDMVLEHAAGAVIGVEVKAAETSEPRTSADCATWRTGSAAAAGPGSCFTPENSRSPSVTG